MSKMINENMALTLDKVASCKPLFLFLRLSFLDLIFSLSKRLTIGNSSIKSWLRSKTFKIPCKVRTVLQGGQYSLADYFYDSLSSGYSRFFVTLDCYDSMLYDYFNSRNSF